MRALVVEDDVIHAELLEIALRDKELEVTICRSLHAALAEDLGQFDCVITDVRLPNDPAKSGISDLKTSGQTLSGIALCREIKQRGYSRPIFITSAVRNEEALNWARDNNVPFIEKVDGNGPMLLALAKAQLIRPPLAHPAPPAALAKQLPVEVATDAPPNLDPRNLIAYGWPAVKAAPFRVLSIALGTLMLGAFFTVGLFEHFIIPGKNGEIELLQQQLENSEKANGKAIKPLPINQK